MGIFYINYITNRLGDDSKVQYDFKSTKDWPNLEVTVRLQYVVFTCKFGTDVHMSDVEAGVAETVEGHREREEENDGYGPTPHSSSAHQEEGWPIETYKEALQLNNRILMAMIKVTNVTNLSMCFRQ